MAIKLPNWTEPAIWAFAAGAIGSWLVLAHGFGWMSAGAAAKMSANKAQEAVVAYATPACMARFERQANAVEAWEALKKADEWDRGGLVEKNGWVAEPKQKLESNIADAIASDCATKILALKTLGGVQLSSK
jgi:hypothetical protein